MAFREEIQAVFSGDTSKFDQAVRSVTVKLRDLASDTAKRFGGLFTLGTMVYGFNKLTNFADQLRRTSEALDVSTDFFQNWTAAARNSGTTAEHSQKGLEKLAANIGKAREEGGDAAAMFEQYGIALEHANGSSKNVEQIARDIANKMRDTSDATVRATMAMDFFGKGGVELVAMLMGGSEALDQFGESVTKLSEIDMKALDDARDMIDNIGHSALIAAGRLTGGLLNAFKRIKDGAVNNDELKDYAKSLSLMFVNPLMGTAFGIDSLSAIGANNSGAGPSLAEGKAKATAEERKATAKRLAEQALEAKKQFDRLRKAEDEGKLAGESNADKAKIMREEIAKLEEAINADQFEGLENDRKRAELQEKRNELKKTEAALTKETEERTKRIAEAEKKHQREVKEFERAAADRRKFTLGQLAGSEDAPEFDPAAGVRGVSRRHRARAAFARLANGASAEERAARQLAQEIERLENNAKIAAGVGRFGVAQDMIASADDLRASLPPDLAKLIDRDPLEATRKGVEESAASLAELSTMFREGTAIVTVPNAK
jgi:hypothetical protein